MRQYLCDLYEIQKIDLAIREVEKRQEAIPAKLNTMLSALAVLKTQVAELITRRDSTLTEIKNLEALVQAETHKLRKWDARLAEIKNQREFLALSREIDGAKKANKDAEDKMAELKTLRDAIQKELETLQDTLAEQEIDAGAEEVRVQQELASVANSTSDDQAKRAALLPKIPKHVLKKYETIRAKKLGMGLAPVTNGCCTACNMRLPPQLYNILQRAESMEQCPSCHRLVFWDQVLESNNTNTP